MKDEPLPPLPSDLAALLATERERPGLSDAAKDRIFERLSTSLPAVPATRRRFSTALGSFLLGVLLGGGLVAALLYRGLGPVQPKLLLLDSPPPPPVAVVVVPAANTPLISMAAPSPASASSSRRAHGDHGASSQPAAIAEERDTDLARERALIETARTALSRKQADAVDALLRHAQQFPRGRLAEERESLLVQALVHAGRIDEARRRGAQFRARWPRSLLWPVVDAALRSIP
jgi:hypothetical protein